MSDFVEVAAAVKRWKAGEGEEPRRDPSAVPRLGSGYRRHQSERGLHHLSSLIRTNGGGDPSTSLVRRFGKLTAGRLTTGQGREEGKMFHDFCSIPPGRDPAKIMKRPSGKKWVLRRFAQMELSYLLASELAKISED